MTQLVVSGNRVVAYGYDCFLATGGTVVCNQTGRVFQNATIVNECGPLPSDIDSVGYEYHAGVFVPCAPYGKDNGNGEILVACEECATPKTSGKRIGDLAPARWTELGTVTDGTPLSVDLNQYNEILCMCDVKGDGYINGGASIHIVPDTLKADGNSYFSVQYSDLVQCAVKISNKNTITSYKVTYGGSETTAYKWYIYGR